MKKLLAIFLAVTMIATFIPSAFAVETDGEGETYDGVKMVYDLENLMVDFNMMGSASTVPFSTLNYVNTNGLFRYVRSIASTTSFNEIGSETQMASSSIGTIYYPGAETTQAFMVLRKGAYVSFEIVVPEDGEYTLELHHQKGTNGATGDVYISSASAFYSLSKFALASLGEKLNSFNCKDTKGNVGSISNTNWTNTEIFTKRVLTAGKYVITYYTSADRVAFGNFILSSGTNPKEIINGGYSIKYDVENAMIANGLHADQNVLTARDIDYNMSNGFFEVVGMSGSVSLASLSSTDYHFLKVKEGALIAFEINVPQTNTYSLKTDYQLAKNGTAVDVYIDGEKVGGYDCLDAENGADIISAGSTTWKPDEVIAEGLKLSAGKHTIRFTALEGTNTSDDEFASVGTFELLTGKLGTLTTDMDGFIKVDDTTLAVDEKANILGAVVCSSDGTVKAQSNANTTYTSSDASVVTVSGSEIMAVGAGTADITTTVGGVTAKRTITVVNKPAGDTVSFAADNVGKLYVNNEEQEYTDLSLLSLNRGDTVMIVADTSDTGKTFRGWVRGSADYGRLVSNSAEYEFTAMTHTFLTAVYSETATADDVEYYGWNEQYITTLPATSEAPTAPTLTGYKFAEWVLGQSDDNIARKVAQYTAEATTYNVSVPEGVSKSVEGGKYVYDAKVTCTANEAVYWYRDNKLVDYGTSYSFYIWGNTEITTLSTGNNGAKVMLDKPKSKAYMIEYDKGTANVVEVGIIFGNSKDITIGNCEEKMNSQRSDFTHGQFSATADKYTTARGYLIYNDKGTYRVIYAD